MKKKVIAAAIVGTLLLGSALQAQENDDTAYARQQLAARQAKAAEIDSLRKKFAANGRKMPAGPEVYQFKIDSLKVAIADIDDAFVKNGLMAANETAPDSAITVPFSADFVERNLNTCDFGYYQDDPARQVFNGGFFSSPDDRTQLLLMCKIYWSGFIKGSSR